MCNYLSSFIRSGDPNCADNDGEPQPAWLPMTVDKPERMFFDDSGSACAEAAPSPVVALIAEATLEKNKF